MLNDFASRLHPQHMDFIWTDALRDWILMEAYDPDYGARPLKRFIQRHIETLIARLIIEGKFGPHQTCTLDFRNNDITTTISS
ncbi:MAG: hypothetical protein MZU97_04610 [Bacillus subtilis]|nr:hypothetical protein [Bacillus subtilis]